MEALDRDMRTGFANLAYVSLREYEANRRTDQGYNEDTRAIANGARAAAWACFVLVGVAVIGAAFALLRAV